MKKNYKMKLKVWQWVSLGGSKHASGGWYFVTLPKDVSTEIRDKIGKGMKKIEVKIGKTIFFTSLLWHNMSKAYLIPIKKSAREEGDIFEGDIINFSFKMV